MDFSADLPDTLPDQRRAACQAFRAGWESGYAPDLAEFLTRFAGHGQGEARRLAGTLRVP
jgi:hypothetical protein